MVAEVLESLIDWSEVLQAAHRSNKNVSRFKHSGVVQADSERIPTLLDLGVSVSGTVILGINVSHDGDVNLGLLEDELVLEDYLKVGVVVIVVKVVSRCTGSV